MHGNNPARDSIENAFAAAVTRRQIKAWERLPGYGPHAKWRVTLNGGAVGPQGGSDMEIRTYQEGKLVAAALASAHFGVAKISREQVEAAVHAAAALLVDGLRPDGQGLCERDCDLMDLKSAAVLALLDDPAVTLDRVIEEGDYPVAASVLRRWWDGWT